VAVNIEDKLGLVVHQASRIRTKTRVWNSEWRFVVLRVKEISVLGLFKKSAPAAPASPGPFGKYQLLERVASGGMADIWLATSESGKVCAVRRLLPELQSDSTAKKRFLKSCGAIVLRHGIR